MKSNPGPSWCKNPEIFSAEKSKCQANWNVAGYLREDSGDFAGKCENLQEEVSLNAIFHQPLHVGLFSTRKDQVVIFLDPKRAVFCTRSWGTDLDCSL